MPTLVNLLEKNRDWAKQSTELDVHFFERLSKAQNPDYLWIGCSDSRVPANQIMNLLPGEVFVHRNIANLVKEEDDNCMSVIQFAIDILKVKHIIVTGHYGCGGIAAAMDDKPISGRLGKWLGSIRELHLNFSEEPSESDSIAALDRMCELNVLDQTSRLSRTDMMKAAWARGQEIEIHSWIYRLNDGIISPLRDVVRQPVEI